MERLALARTRAQEGRRAIIEAAKRPCASCRHFTLLRACENPAVTGVETDLVTGNIAFPFVRAGDARSSEGLCGPSGELFEEAGFTQSLLRYRKAAMIGGVITAAGLLFDILV